MNIISTISVKQAERVTVGHLKSLHDEMTRDFYVCAEEGLLVNEERCGLIRDIVAIETILRVLVTTDEYLNWKTIAGFDSTY